MKDLIRKIEESALQEGEGSQFGLYVRWLMKDDWDRTDIGTARVDSWKSPLSFTPTGDKKKDEAAIRSIIDKYMGRKGATFAKAIKAADDAIKAKLGPQVKVKVHSLKKYQDLTAKGQEDLILHKDNIRLDALTKAASEWKGPSYEVHLGLRYENSERGAAVSNPKRVASSAYDTVMAALVKSMKGRKGWAE